MSNKPENENMELTDDQLTGVAGGEYQSSYTCPQCGHVQAVCRNTKLTFIFNCEKCEYREMLPGQLS